MNWRWLVALLLLAGPSRADLSWARYDLALSQVMLRQTAVVLQAGSLLEEWEKGRKGLTQAQAARTLEGQRQQALRLTQELERLPCPASAGPLRKAALATCRGRVELLRLAQDYLARGSAEPASKRAFLAQTLARTGELQSEWLNARLVAARAGAEGTPAAVRAYYDWQNRILPLTRTQLKIGGEIQRLVLLDREGTTSPLSIIEQAGQATRLSFEVRDKAAAIQPPASLRAAHRLARVELAALSELCANVKLFAGDRSEEALTRVNRATRELRKASQEAEQASLQALKAALADR